MLFEWDFDEKTYFKTINDSQNATYEEVPEYVPNMCEEKSYFIENKNDEFVLKEVCTMDNICESDLFVL